MKRNLFILSLILTSMTLTAQRPLVTVFSENGEKFWLILDGVKKNPEPQYRVENVVMENDWAKVKIIFEDPSIQDIEKTIQGLDYDGKPNAVTHIIKKTKKGNYELRVLSWKPLSEAGAQQPLQNDPPLQQEKITPQEATKADVPSSTTQSTGTQTTTTTSTTGTQENAGIIVNIGTNDTQGENVNFKMDISVPGQVTNNNTTTVQTVTTTTTSTKVNENQTPQLNTRPVVQENQKDEFNCSGPVNSADFSGMKNSISSKSFEDSKLTTAKQIAKSNCLSSLQIKEIMEIFSFEDTRLEFAKLAYLNCWDKKNYFQVNDAFTFESSIEELNEYINSIH